MTSLNYCVLHRFLSHKEKMISGKYIMSAIPSTMTAKFRNEISWNGYKADVLKSGVQKYVRRGLLDKALYCGGELDLFKYVDGGERVRSNFLHRLMIIFLEDIGPSGIFSMAEIR
jgi:hypothetical protein